MLRIKPLPPLAYLRECFLLDKTCPSGLRWRKRPRGHFPTCAGWAVANGKCGNRSAGTIKTGTTGAYWFVKIAGTSYPVHRIVFSMYNERQVPIELQIDHRDNKGLNNDISNLREATCSENRQNSNACKRTDQKRIKGVFFHQKSGLWHGGVRLNGKLHHVGYSPSKEKIVSLVRQLREELHKEFINHGI